MLRRELCRNDLPPKGLVLSIGGLAVLLGLVTLALGYGVVPLDPEWLRAPRWMMAGAGLMFIMGGIAITLIVLPAHRRERSHQG